MRTGVSAKRAGSQEAGEKRCSRLLSGGMDRVASDGSTGTPLKDERGESDRVQLECHKTLQLGTKFVRTDEKREPEAHIIVNLRQFILVGD